jgi:hypothetical protein
MRRPRRELVYDTPSTPYRSARADVALSALSIVKQQMDAPDPAVEKLRTDLAAWLARRKWPDGRSEAGLRPHRSTVGESDSDASPSSRP